MYIEGKSIGSHRVKVISVSEALIHKLPYVVRSQSWTYCIA